MEPRIQYAQTADGVSIAFYTLGVSMPLVYMAPLLSIETEWQIPGYGRWYERLAEKRMLVRYDNREAGQSKRDVADYSLDAYLLDLEAVVNHLGLDRFALYATIFAGAVAVAYTAHHPEQVSHLILSHSFARGSDFVSTPPLQGLRALMEHDWELFTETAAHVMWGWSAGEPARRGAAILRKSLTREALRAALQGAGELDVTGLLPQVKSPTLVLHRRDSLWPVQFARSLASGIPDARLVLLEGTSVAPYVGDTEAILRAIDEFLAEGKESATATELPEGMAVLLFADIAESTALTEQLGDSAFRAKARELDTSLRSVIRQSGGTPVEGKVLGDGVLAVFTSARQAIDCALRCEAASEPLGLQLHLGIHAGDVIREGDNVYGGAVNIAARIATASAPGEVLVSDTVRSLARTSAGVTFDDRGQRKLKGVEGRQRLFAVRGQPDG